MEPEYLIIHHSLTEDSGTVSWQAIRRYHVDECAWDDIGYHFGIELIQSPPEEPRYEILIGRMPNLPGAHTKGMNNKSIGICCVGNFDVLAPPPDQWFLCKNLVGWLMDVYGIPRENVRGHRDFAAKTCPGRLFDMVRFRAEL